MALSVGGLDSPPVGGGGGRGVLLGILDGDVLPSSSNPDPISDQKSNFPDPFSD